MMPEVATRSPRAVSIFPILSVNFIGTMGFSIVLPFLIFLVTRWGGNALIYGIMGATYSVFQLIGAPILGRWSDVYGRRKILLLSQLGTLISWLVFLAAFFLPSAPFWHVNSEVLGSFAITLPLITLFVARACDGITGGNISVANAYLADITDEQDRSANFGKMAVAANLGFIVGPAIAGLLGGTVWGEMLPVLAAVAISAVATALIAFRLPESKLCILKRDPEHTNVRKVFGQEQKGCFEIQDAEKLSMREIFQIKNVPLLLTIYFLVMLGFNFFYVSFPVYVAGVLAWGVADTGIFFAVLSFLMVIVQGPVLGRVSRRVSDPLLAVIGSLILSGSFVFFITDSKALIYTGAALLALGNGLMWPSVVSILSKAAGEKHQGAVQGLAGSVGAVASVVGLVVGGVLYGIFAEWIFALSAVIILAAFLMSWMLHRSISTNAVSS